MTQCVPTAALLLVAAPAAKSPTSLLPTVLSRLPIAEPKRSPEGPLLWEVYGKKKKPPKNTMGNLWTFYFFASTMKIKVFQSSKFGCAFKTNVKSIILVWSSSNSSIKVKEKQVNL